MLKLRYPWAIRIVHSPESGLGFMHEFRVVGHIDVSVQNSPENIKREESLGQTLYLQNLKIIFGESLTKET